MKKHHGNRNILVCHDGFALRLLPPAYAAHSEGVIYCEDDVIPHIVRKAWEPHGRGSGRRALEHIRLIGRP